MIRYAVKIYLLGEIVEIVSDLSQFKELNVE